MPSCDGLYSLRKLSELYYLRPFSFFSLCVVVKEHADRVTRLKVFNPERLWRGQCKFVLSEQVSFPQPLQD